MDRFYESYGVTLTDSTVETLLLWNTDAAFRSLDHDPIFTQLILVNVFGAESIAARNVRDTGKLRFVREIFAHRVDCDITRCNKLDAYIQEVLWPNNARSEETSDKVHQLPSANEELLVVSLDKVPLPKKTSQIKMAAAELSINQDQSFSSITTEDQHAGGCHELSDGSGIRLDHVFPVTNRMTLLNPRMNWSQASGLDTRMFRMTMNQTNHLPAVYNRKAFCQKQYLNRWHSSLRMLSPRKSHSQ